MEIQVLTNVMVKNNAIGDDNRDLFLKNNIVTFNFTSSPGAGKTTLLENSLGSLIKKFNMAIIEGDLYTSYDAKRLQHFDIPIVQINTSGGCHLDAKMINESLKGLPLPELDVIYIENVGNLVCPSSFDLGEHYRVLVFSVTEGIDKPQKYKHMFQNAHVIIINKIDLAKACNIDIEKVEQEIREINKTCKIFKTSAIDPESLVEWNQWIEKTIHDVRKDQH